MIVFNHASATCFKVNFTLNCCEFYWRVANIKSEKIQEESKCTSVPFSEWMNDVEFAMQES